MNGVLVPHMVNEHEMLPSRIFDLSGKRRNMLDNYGSIPRMEVLRWGEVCMRYGADYCGAAGMKYKLMNQTWILTLAQNSCTPELNAKVNNSFFKATWASIIWGVLFMVDFKHHC